MEENRRSGDLLHPERRRDVRLAYAYAQRLASEFELDFGAITFKVDHGVIHAIQVTRRIDERDVVRLDEQELEDLGIPGITDT